MRKMWTLNLQKIDDCLVKSPAAEKEKQSEVETADADGVYPADEREETPATAESSKATQLVIWHFLVECVVMKLTAYKVLG